VKTQVAKAARTERPAQKDRAQKRRSGRGGQDVARVVCMDFVPDGLSEIIQRESSTIGANLKFRADAAAAIARENADEVDREGRFPAEAIAAVREQRLLGILVPTELGGEGASVSDVADLCYVLGRSCASTAMIFAMHQIMVAILVRHAIGSSWHKQLLRRLSAEQMLLASSTTDGQGGGDLRKSSCAIEQNGSLVTLCKSATVISYGVQGDAVLTTARRSADAAPSDQVLAAFLKKDYELEPLMDWDALGMRGTSSAGFTLNARGKAEQVLPEPYQKIQAHTMMPVAHLTWGAVWAGLAADAVERARASVRAAARRSGGQLPPGAIHLTRATMSLRSLRSLLGSAMRRFESAAAQVEEIESFDFQSIMNLLKVNASELAIATVTSAMQAAGLAGYRNGGEFSVSRHIRDVLSSSVMINNDRILASATASSFLIDVPDSLRD
jgi:acyl-CoA dehydrogenase